MPLLETSHHLWRVWRANARASVIREMEFRSNFILGIIRQLLWLASFIFIIHTIFTKTSSLAGWNQRDVLIILALSRFVEGIINVFFQRNIADLPQIVQRGDFDFNLLKPGSAQFYTAFRRLYIFNMGNLVAGILLLIYALLQGPLPSLRAGVFFALLISLGLIIYYSLIILVASLVFFIERLEALWGFLILFSEPFTVPFDIFPRVPRLAITYLLPLAFVVFVPAQALTGRLQWWQLPVAAGLAALFLLLANLAWRAGLRRYSSASS